MAIWGFVCFLSCRLKHVYMDLKLGYSYKLIYCGNIYLYSTLMFFILITFILLNSRAGHCYEKKNVIKCWYFALCLFLFNIATLLLSLLDLEKTFENGTPYFFKESHWWHSRMVLHHHHNDFLWTVLEKKMFGKEKIYDLAKAME